MTMTINQLTTYANEFLQKEFNLGLEVSLIRNNRLRSCLGAMVFTDHTENEIDYIELAGKTLDYGCEGAILDVLKHELVHYALFKLNKPYDDGDAYFEDTLKRLGITSTDTSFIGVKYEYECVKCGCKKQTTLKGVKTKTKDYSSTCCDAKIKFTGEQVFDGSDYVNYLSK